MYHLKRRTVYKSLLKKVDVEDVDLCHATTLFSDGGLAYLLYRRTNIPYFVTVRITDLLFLLKAPHTWLSAKKILLNASKIIFVSPTLQNKFCSHRFVKKYLPVIEKKIVLSRNGIDDYWIDNVNTYRRIDSHNVLYIGTMIRRKNPLLLIESVLELKNKYSDIKLNIIGATGEDETAVIEKAKVNSDVITYYGRITDKTVLKEHYRNNSIFVLPSVRETFGLVYLEALSQNIPVIYIKGEGIDGLLNDYNGEGLECPSVENIKESIEKVFKFYNKYSNKDIDFESFRWSKIASEYYKLYSNCCHKSV